MFFIDFPTFSHHNESSLTYCLCADTHQSKKCIHISGRLGYNIWDMESQTEVALLMIKNDV